MSSTFFAAPGLIFFREEKFSTHNLPLGVEPQNVTDFSIF